MNVGALGVAANSGRVGEHDSLRREGLLEEAHHANHILDLEQPVVLLLISKCRTHLGSLCRREQNQVKRMLARNPHVLRYFQCHVDAWTLFSLGSFDAWASLEALLRRRGALFLDRLLRILFHCLALSIITVVAHRGCINAFRCICRFGDTDKRTLGDWALRFGNTGWSYRTHKNTNEDYIGNRISTPLPLEYLIPLLSFYHSIL